MYVKGINFVKYDHIPNGTEALTKVRYKHQEKLATLSNEAKLEYFFMQGWKG